MTRTPAYLAAVASSAVPGLDAVAVRAARGLPGNRCDVGFVTDTQRRAWVVRLPTTAAVGAQLDAAADLLPLLNRRVPFSVPMPRGFLAVPEGRAVVYPYLHGRSVLLGEVTPGPGVAAEIGRAVAALHNVERAVFEEAGTPVYEAEACRTRHLADLDRGAATGHVPTALLSRWERALEDVSAWRFAPTPVHGDLSGGRFLVTFSDEADPDTASVRAVTGWEHARVGDPADDFAVLVADCAPETFESIVEAYSLARIERPDRHLRHRARLGSELRLLAQLLDAVHSAQPPLITRRAAELRTLDQRTADEPALVVAEAEPPARTPQAGSGATASTGVIGGADASAASTASAAAPVEFPDLRDDDTQLLKTGTAADATTVIPPAELERLRDRGGATEDRSDESEQDAASWFQVLEAAPVPDPEPASTPADEERVSTRGDSAPEVVDAPAEAGDQEPAPEPSTSPVTDTQEEAPAPPAADEPSSADTAPLRKSRPVADRPEADRPEADRPKADRPGR